VLLRERCPVPVVVIAAPLPAVEFEEPSPCDLSWAAAQSRESAMG